SLSHDLFYDNDFLLARTTNLFQFLSLSNKAVIKLFHNLADFLCDDIKSSVGSQRSTTLHVCLLLDHDVTLDEDLAFIRAARTSPHDVLVKVSLRRTELTDLNSAFICTCQHHNNAVQNSCHTCTEVSVALFCSDGLFVHDSLGICVIFV